MKRRKSFMPQFDYQQLCHFVLPEQGGLSVETILKRFLHLTPREIRHAKYIPDGIQKNGVSCRTNAVVQTGDTITFRYAQKCPHLSEDQVLPVSRFIQCADPTNTDFAGILPRCPVGSCNSNTRHQTLQTTGYILNRTILQLFAVYHSNRT